jgi:hypothetical protein
MSGRQLEPGDSRGRPPAMSTLSTRLERLIWTGLAGIGLGLSVLLVYAWVEYLNNPGISLVDGYWIGRLPWIPLGIGLVLAGSALTLLSSALRLMLRGDWLRRVLILGVLALPVPWWLVALGMLPFPRYQPPDPVTLAYSLPEMAAIALILPAIAGAALALAPVTRERRVRLRPVTRP